MTGTGRVLTHTGTRCSGETRGALAGGSADSRAQDKRRRDFPPSFAHTGSEGRDQPQPQPWLVVAFSPVSNEWPQEHDATAFGLRTVKPPPMRELM